jgi:hypothetical protein
MLYLFHSLDGEGNSEDVIVLDLCIGRAQLEISSRYISAIAARQVASHESR